MNKFLNRQKEISSALAAANRTADLKRKMTLSSALAEANSMADDTNEPNLPQSSGTSKKKRVVFPSSKSFTNSNILSLSFRRSVIHEKLRDQVPTNESHIQNVSCNSDERISSHAREDEDQTTDNSIAPDDQLNVKGKRGPTIGLNIEKYTRKNGEKPTIIIPEGLNKPVGLHASKHASLIGVLIKLEAPMQVDDWSKIPDEKKKELFKKLVNKLNYEVEKPHVLKCIYKSFAKSFSNFRSNAYKHYKAMKAEGGVALAKEVIYDKLIERKEDWLWLCEYWETEKFQNLDDIDMYEVVYHNEKNGWANEEAERNNVKMKELREQQNTLPEDTTRMNAEQICVAVIGENSSYIKSKSLKKKKSLDENTSLSESSIHQARLEEELSNAKAEIEAQKNTMTNLFKFLEKMTGESIYDILNQQD
ncbi:hypothetical protein ACJIZ3_003735 [Penstemon smallii]|uniref:Uncharacterized protein n=1 Tax=Penstemon smallii TaxID=265156 RepID=A0ABD3UA16_9LAMI